MADLITLIWKVVPKGRCGYSETVISKIFGCKSMDDFKSDK